MKDLFSEVETLGQNRCRLQKIYESQESGDVMTSEKEGSIHHWWEELEISCDFHWMIVFQIFRSSTNSIQLLSLLFPSLYMTR